jgi:hypothetical protein
MEIIQYLIIIIIIIIIIMEYSQRLILPFKTLVGKRNDFFQKDNLGTRFKNVHQPCTATYGGNNGIEQQMAAVAIRNIPCALKAGTDWAPSAAARSALKVK